MYSPVVLSIFASLWKDFQNFSSCKTTTLFPLNNFPDPPTPQVLDNTILPSVSINLTTLKYLIWVKSYCICLLVAYFAVSVSAQTIQVWAPLVPQMVKNLPAVQETQVQSLDWEDLLKKGLATHTVFLPGEFHGQRSLVDYSPWGRKESDVTERLNTHTHIKVYPCCSMSLNFLPYWIVSHCMHLIFFYVLNCPWTFGRPLLGYSE